MIRKRQLERLRRTLLVVSTIATLVVLLAGSCSALGTGEYVITSRESGKVLTVDPSMFNENGANVMQWDHHTDGKHQVWTVTHVGNNLFKIINWETKKCLEVTGWGPGGFVAEDDGTSVRQWEYIDSWSQKWRIEWVEEDYYRLVNAYSGKCLDLEKWSHENGGDVQQWACHDGKNQQWRFVQWGAVKIVDVQWVPHNGGYLNVIFDSFPAWNGGNGWKFYLDGVELPMDGGPGKPCIRPNGAVDSATGVYIATEPWVTGLGNVDFPCVGRISFYVPQIGFTNAHAYDLTGSGCSTAAAAKPEGEIKLGVDF